MDPGAAAVANVSNIYSTLFGAHGMDFQAALAMELVCAVSPGPLASGPVYSDVLIGISVASLSLVVGILALLCHLRNEQGATLGELEYKCAASAKDVVLQNMSMELTPQKL